MTSFRDTDETETINMWAQRGDRLSRVQLSSLYHRKREWFFDALDKSIKAIAVISASSALTPLVTGDGVLAVQFFIVTTGTIALVLDFSERARKHSDLAVRYAQVERDIASAGEIDFTTEDIRRWTVALYETQSAETATLRGLVQLCQDELDAAKGDKVPQENFAFWRRFSAHFGFGVMPIDTPPAS